MDIDALLDPGATLPAVVTKPLVLTPGPHRDDNGRSIEIGTHQFADDVLLALPATTLFRWDFVVGELIGAPGQRRFQPISEHRMRTIVDRHVRLARWQTPKGSSAASQIFCACRRDWSGLVLAQAAVSDRVPKLTMLTRYPVYAPAYERVRPGWNPEHGIYYDEPAHLAGLIPAAHPTLDLFDDLVVDFPFSDNASRHNFLGALVTVTVRPAIDGCVPYYLLTAPLERTGKGKLIESIVGRGLMGRNVPVMQLGAKEEEREKRVTSVIVDGSTVIHLDNLPTEEVLDSPSLASLATARVWKGRLLGFTKSPELPNNLVVFMSGNNVKTTGEITKRTIPICLQPLDAHPEDRTEFEHPDIEEYAAAHQRRLIEEILGMVEAWKDAGRPTSSTIVGGFEAWSRDVGGIVKHAGGDAYLANYRAWVRLGDEFAADAEVLVEAWARRHHGAEITATEVLELVRATGTFSFVTARPEAGQGVVLARRVLTPLTNRPVAGWVVRRVGSGSSSRYRLDEALPI